MAVAITGNLFLDFEAEAKFVFCDSLQRRALVASVYMNTLL